MNFFKKICVGVYKGLSSITSPFIKGWNKASDSLYNTVNKTNSENIEASAANMNMNMNGLSNTINDNSNSINQMPNSNVVNNGEQNNENGTLSKSATDFNHKNLKKTRISAKLEQSRQELLQLVNSKNDTRCDHKIAYRYTVVNSEGILETNYMLGFSRTEIFTFLENEGNTVYEIITSPTIEKLCKSQYISSSKMAKKDIVFWLQQLSTYIKSGIPLTDAMRILAKQMGNKNSYRRIFRGIIYNLTLGESFSSCLERQENAFPPLLVNIIKSAEATGDLEGSLDDMAEYYGETEKTRKAMVSALTYPAIVCVFSIAVVIFLLVYLLPQFKSIYAQAGAELNSLTSFLLSVSDFLKANWATIIAFIAVIVITIVILYRKVKEIRYAMQKFAMKLPVFGKLIIYKEMMIFTKTFANLLNNNVFITESMEILQKTTTNEIYREIMINTVDYIGRGEKISSAFQGHWAVPDVAYYMMVTGESTGELANMMQNVANYYSTQHKSMVDSLKSLIEPIMILFLAVTVGGILIAVVIPLFGLYSKIM